MTALNRTPAKITANTVNHTSNLRRLVMANMLWENQFYIDGVSNAQLLSDAISRVPADQVQAIALEARSRYKLRHVPLQILRELARAGKLQAQALSDTIQRPDEIGEFISLYWKEKREPLSNQVKRGLALAFLKFNEYQFGKWDKNSAAVRLRDAMFLCHPKPQSAEQATLFAKIAGNQLATPDTWEVELSGGADKHSVFTRLMGENKLGALAFIRNLRNMTDAGVSTALINAYADVVNTDRVLPFRFLAAARIVPQFAPMLERMMLRSLKAHEPLLGKTVLLIDVSGSMFGTKVSERSDLDRFDAAAALAVLAREICESVEIYTFSDHLVRVPNARGFELVEALKVSQRHNGTRLGSAVQKLHGLTQYTRCIVFTDEQSRERVEAPQGLGYVINVAAYEKGISNQAWTTITGMSEAVIDYIQEVEKLLD